ncbi:hypothetical protein [Halobacillus sp. BBL2006]|uniref:hypothetical protein n=1 Tax=Halobacillus sp. BBL2006 TaxID=1543706 RepID=UPI000542EC25|nr:hypothetical protein [Halobacillus sp. BBL2006]KHE67089.1 hypothetical protein LD39_19350 [Halobacillus sp. BBL2006]
MKNKEKPGEKDKRKKTEKPVKDDGVAEKDKDPSEVNEEKENNSKMPKKESLKVKEKKGVWEISLPKSIEEDDLQKNQIVIMNEKNEIVEGEIKIIKNGRMLEFKPAKDLDPKTSYTLWVIYDSDEQKEVSYPLETN